MKPIATPFLARLLAYGLRQLRKKLGFRPTTVRDVKRRRHPDGHIEIQPAEQGQFPPAVTLPGQTKRAVANYFGDVKEYVEYATMTQCTHVATSACIVNDVVYDRGYLYKGLSAEHISSLGMPTPSRPEFRRKMLLCSTSAGSRYFGDWLLTDNLLELLAEQLGIEPLKIAPHTKYPHLEYLTAILGLSAYRDYGPILIEELWIIDDSGYNQGKRRRLRELRARLWKNFDSPHVPERFVYLRRGERYMAGRALSNEDEVVESLRAKGFCIIDPSRCAAREVLEKTIGSSLVVGVEGSQMGYGFLGLREGGLMLTLQPPYHFQSAFRPRCASVGVDWGFIIGTKSDGGFSIDVPELGRILAPFIAG